MKLTAQDVVKMKSVNFGEISADMLPDVSGMAFDNSQSRKERMSSFLCHADNPYCFCVGGVGVKIEEGPTLQDALCAFLLRQYSGL